MSYPGFNGRLVGKYTDYRQIPQAIVTTKLGYRFFFFSSYYLNRYKLRDIIFSHND